jgi:hypothetical protein
MCKILLTLCELIRKLYLFKFVKFLCGHWCICVYIKSSVSLSATPSNPIHYACSYSMAYYCFRLSLHWDHQKLILSLD